MALLNQAPFYLAGAYNRLAEMGLQYGRICTNGYINSEKALDLRQQLVRSTKLFRLLMYYTRYDSSGNFLGTNRITDDIYNKLLRTLIRTADVNSLPNSPKILYNGNPLIVQTGGTGPVGPAGAASYLYIGYADDAAGTGFSTSPATHPYIAIVNSTSPMTVVAGIFAGLWTKYFGNNGADGAAGANGTTYYLHIGYADDTSGTNYTPVFSSLKAYIAFIINTTAGDPGAGAFAGLWARYLGTNGTNGTNGNTVIGGAGAPSGGIGVDGDYYIDVTAHAFYGPKTAGAWGASFSLVGPAGATGSTGSNGADGNSAFLYIAYADDALGTGFTTAFDPSKKFIAFKNTNVLIPSPAVSDFTGLFTAYRGTGDQWTTTSPTSLTIGAGVQTLFVATSLAYATGQRVVIAVPADPTHMMQGVCQGYNPLTGQLTVNVDTTTGAGTFSSWQVSLQGAPVSIASVNGYFGAIGTQRGSGGTNQATTTTPARLGLFENQISQSPGITADNVTNFRLTVANRGAYVLSFHGSISGSNNGEFILQLYKNGVAVANAKTHALLNASGQVQNISIGSVSIDNVAVNDYFEIYVNAVAGTPNILLEQGTFDIHSVGSPNTPQYVNIGPTNVVVGAIDADIFSAGAGNSVRWDVMIKRGNQIREITVYAIWDGTNPPNSNSSTPTDLAGPIDVVLTVTFSGGNIHLVATGTSATWVVTGKRTIIA